MSKHTRFPAGGVVVWAAMAWFSVVGGLLASPVAPFDCEPRPLGRIPPGTRVGDSPPRGWTHLISKSLPQLAEGEAEKLNARAADLTRFLFTAMLARVGARRTSYGTYYRLEDLAIGIGTRIGREDVIITSQTQSQLGAGLGMLQRWVLSSAEHELDRIVQLAISETSRIVDMPTSMLIGGRHRPIVVRYIFMVHPGDGRLEVVLWRIDVDASGAYRLAQGPAVRRTLGLVETRLLHVDADHTLAGLPSSKAFATMQLPTGEPFPMPGALRDIAGQRVLTAAMAEQMDIEFRRAVGFLARR